MDILGNWALTIQSPQGVQNNQLSIVADGEGFKGELRSSMGQVPVTDGKIDGDKASWTAKMSQPMPITLEFSATVSGDTLSGQVKAGGFGAFPFSGARA